MATPIILIVEDEALIRDYLADVLVESRFQVLMAATADQAIPLLESRDDIRLLITDIDMPGTMDGLRLAAAVQQRWPPIKIIIATGKAKPDATQLPHGSMFLTKPYDRKVLVNTVERILS